MKTGYFIDFWPSGHSSFFFLCLLCVFSRVLYRVSVLFAVWILKCFVLCFRVSVFCSFCVLYVFCWLQLLCCAVSVFLWPLKCCYVLGGTETTTYSSPKAKT